MAAATTTTTKKSSKLSSTSSSSALSSASSSKVVALPSMSHSLSHLPNMPSVDPRTLHYGGLGASKEASHAKLQQALQRRDQASTCGGRSSSYHTQPQYPHTSSSRKGNGGDDGDYLMMNKGRKKPA